MSWSNRVGYGFFAVVFICLSGLLWFSATEVMPLDLRYALSSALSGLVGIMIFALALQVNSRENAERELRDTKKELEFAFGIVSIFVDNERRELILTDLAKAVQRAIDDEEKALDTWSPPDPAPRNDKHRLRLEKLTHHRHVSEIARDHFDKAYDLLVKSGYQPIEIRFWEVYAGEELQPGVARPLKHEKIATETVVAREAGEREPIDPGDPLGDPSHPSL